MTNTAPSGLGRWLLVALSLSIGWGIRGNFGHEIGAMLPGALAAMAAILTSGREDWHRRLPFFALGGALGWAVGGSISYMQVIAYTHSGHSGSVLYGFACLFTIGFLWAAIGGAATALPAFLSRQRLVEFFPTFGAVLAVKIVQEAVVAIWFSVNPDFRQESPLYWYDTNWLDALDVLVAVGLLSAVRRRFDHASSLLLHCAIGWWIGFLLLVLAFGLRMTPPRGDNWAGCLGLVAGAWVYFQRNGLVGATWASLTTGLIGGFGFATATLFKLVGITTGWQTNWHSVLEQSYGFINGIGVATALFWLARTAPKLEEEPPIYPWAEPLASGLVLFCVAVLNLRQNPRVWVEAKSVPGSMYGITAQTWLDAAYILLIAAFIALALYHRRRPLAALPSTWLGRGQLLYLVLLWWMVGGNFERALVSFTPQRLVTEGVIHFNAALCTVLLFTASGFAAPALDRSSADWPRLLRKTASIGIAATIVSVSADWALVRAIYGDRFAGYAGKHIRFGPDATATKAKPKPGELHP